MATIRHTVTSQMLPEVSHVATMHYVSGCWGSFSCIVWALVYCLQNTHWLLSVKTTLQAPSVIWEGRTAFYM